MLAFAALSYAARSTNGRPDANVLYRYSTFESYLVQYALIGVIIWAIAGLGSRRELFALRRPSSWRRAAGLAVGVILGMYVLSAALGPVLHPGREQGLTPTRWEPAHATAYIVNGLAIVVLAPVLEELTFRGLGFSLLRRYGEWTAILLVGLLFGLAHGLVEALPFLVAFGIGLAFIRSRTGSVYPGMIVHGFFNATALIFAVVH
ncbi:MAG: CPBP family intramembrane metalloprotease [Actinobacteria bacterium]|nr:MAG: CPBP family intramembrane metalloprotease [Actinomycetota bacterium]